MIRRLALLLTMTLLPVAAQADDGPWRVSLYGGIATRNDTTQLFLHGHFHPDGSQIGLSVDRDIVDLGSGFTLVGEGGATRFVAKSDESSVELGLGVRYEFHFLGDPVSVAGFTGPSWADDPPVISTGSFHVRPINFKENAWLNYVGAEVAVGIAPDWNVVLRYYHRSGAFGLFQPNADEGSTLGVGLQYRF
ncbi:MAG: hypothetical protein JWP16_1116 [Alphaproteobacteria bacterium]|nr:hypothetical protein [Alphaproteobacteria bacterium]